jgi:ATP-dependent DNA helicase RecG
LTYTIFEAAYKKITKKAMTMKEYVSFGMCHPDGTLTYAGLLFADDSPLLQCRIFCTHWNGLTKGSVGDDAIDAEEFQGDIISLLKNSHNFVRLNSKVRWKKMSDHRINKPDYADRAVFEALTNALMHRDYSIIGSEVHVDMYDDRIDIFSPGGMYDGSLIQELDIEKVPSIRRNPIVADIFNRLEFSERQGSGLRKIREETSHLHGYMDDLAPEFLSTPSAFHVILKNMNFNLVGDLESTHQDAHQVNPQDVRYIRAESILAFCSVPRTRDEIQIFTGLADRGHFRTKILKPLLDSGKLKMTIPDKPNKKKQKYIKV